MDDCPKKQHSDVASDLPEDPLVEILARIPARSLCRSKCVAKHWRDVIEDPLHRKKLPQTLQGFFSITKGTCGLHIGYVSLIARSSARMRRHIGYISLIARSARRQIDPSLSFLTKLPGFEKLTFLDSCNGFLVFDHIDKSLGYIVCNPTTEQWGVVPRCGPPPSASSTYQTGSMYMFLVFDPAVSSHFHLVQFVRGWEDDDDDGSNDDEETAFVSVNVYSSESGQWIQIESDWYKHKLEDSSNLNLGFGSAVLNGLLHFIVYADQKVQIAAVDVQGVTRKIVSVPVTAGKKHWSESYVALSQGRLHYITKTADGAQLSIWVLEDYDTQKWGLKHCVNFMKLFGRMSRPQSCGGHEKDYSVVAMHPDGNLVFLVQEWDRKLISYDMDHMLVNVIGTLEDGTSTMDVVPYVPCFLESPALTNTL